MLFFKTKSVGLGLSYLPQTQMWKYQTVMWLEPCKHFKFAISPQSEGDNTSKHFMCIYLYCFVVKDSLRNTNTIYFTFRKSMIWSCYSLKFSMMAIVILTFVAQKSQYLNWRSEYQLNLQVALIRSCEKKSFLLICIFQIINQSLILDR